MIKLQWLRINEFRKVKPGTLLTFNPGYNVLLGQNGVGKTTLLSLISAIFRFDFSDFKDEEFSFEFEFKVPGGTAHTTVKNGTIPRSHVRKIGVVVNGQKLIYELPISIDGEKTTSLVEQQSKPNQQTEESSVSIGGFSFDIKLQPDTTDRPALNISLNGVHGTVYSDDKPASKLTFEAESGKQEGRSEIGNLLLDGVATWLILRAQSSKDLGLEESSYFLRMVYLLGSTSVSRFDESLGFYAMLAGGELEIVEGSFPFSDERMDGVPRALSLKEKAIEAARKDWTQLRLVISDSQLPFLKRLTQLMGFQSAEVWLEFERSSTTRHERALKSGNQKFIFTHQDGSRIADRHLSYGQRRMLAFMYYLECVEHVAIADELVNGLHHQWIQVCLEELGERQVFLTSQNPLLLDYLTFESPEDVRSQFVLCRWEQGKEQMIWENMSQEAAEDFFASYKVGFQQVGELLQSKGLW
jgi:energy-coupling factor transporter ATP-binding protein EcfA2